jgi:hypothetical protein
MSLPAGFIGSSKLPLTIACSNRDMDAISGIAEHGPGLQNKARVFDILCLQTRC